MRILALLFVVLGVALAGGAIYFGNQYLAQQAALTQQDTGPRTVNVIAAATRLNYGDRINKNTTYNTLRFVQWPEDSVPPGAFTSEQDLLGPDSAETRTVLRAIEPGELVLASKVTGFGERVRMATKVSDGMRAFTFSIDAVSGIAGHVAPGDHVDILLTRTIDRQLTTSVILQNVLVIARDQDTNTESTRTRVSSTATVEVTPTEAQKLTLAQQVGRLSLTLRGANEPTNAPVEAMSIEDLPDQPERVEVAPEPVVEAPKRPTVRVRKGGALVETPID